MELSNAVWGITSNLLQSCARNQEFDKHERKKSSTEFELSSNSSLNRTQTPKQNLFLHAKRKKRKGEIAYRIRCTRWFLFHLLLRLSFCLRHHVRHFIAFSNRVCCLMMKNETLNSIWKWSFDSPSNSFFLLFDAFMPSLCYGFSPSARFVILLETFLPQLSCIFVYCLLEFCSNGVRRLKFFIERLLEVGDISSDMEFWRWKNSVSWLKVGS